MIPILIVLAILVFDVVFMGVMRKPRMDRLDELIAPYLARYDDLTAGLAGALNFPGPGLARIDALEGPPAGGAGEGYLSAPVALPCEQDDRVQETATTDLPGPVHDSAEMIARESSSRAGEPTFRSMGYWPMDTWQEMTVHNWARIARRQKGGWLVESWIRAYRAAREKVRHEARMAAISERSAEPMPQYLDRQWSQQSGSFAIYCGGPS